MHSRNKFALRALVLSAILFAANTAYAGDTGSVATMDEPTRLMSLTFSPVHLANPVVEITGEFKAHEKWGLALIGGAGSVAVDGGVLDDQTFSVWEAGGQLRYYVLGDFDHGMQLGAELLYVNISSDDIESGGDSISAIGEGLGVGPFVGYKIATQIGFTFDAQLGIHRTFLGAEAEDSSGATESAEESDWGPFLNLNVGWSF